MVVVVQVVAALLILCAGVICIAVGIVRGVTGGWFGSPPAGRARPPTAPPDPSPLSPVLTTTQGLLWPWVPSPEGGHE